MKTKMTHAMRMELANAVRDRYAAATTKDKRRILEEFIAATGYHEKSAIRVLNSHPEAKHRQTRQRPSLYDEAARGTLIVLWEASDRVCGKRLKALLPILLPALERNGHLKLEEEIRHKILSMSAATIDRLLQMPRRTMRTKKPPRVMPEPRRRIKMRTFADWNEPLPGSMEMDLVAHCGEANRGSYVHSLVLTDIASGWTEAAPIVVREGTLVVETLDRIRTGLPFALRALDVDNGSEFVNNRLIEYCLGHGIELTRSRPYRKNDQAWIEQKNGAVVRKLMGYRRFEGLAAARAITRLYAASRLFVNFFQPSFKLAAKQRDGAKVAKRYHPPQSPCERLLQAEAIPMAAKNKLREIAGDLDPLKLLEEMRAVQAYLAALADGETPPPATSEPPNLAAFVASLSSAWHAGEIRPTFSIEAKPRYLRSLQKLSTQTLIASPSPTLKPVIPPTPPATMQEKPKPVYAEPGQARVQALRMVWPIVCRRLEEFPNINATQLFEELCVQFPGRFTRKQYKTLVRRVNLWRQAARARGVVVGPKTYRRLNDKPRGRRPDIFKDHWEEMARCLEERPDQTALELLVEFQVRYPGRYSLHQLHTLQKRVRAWRQQAVQRLIGEVSSLAPYVASDSARLASG
ncbi:MULTISPECIES: integrase catalytic domain-containing protein [unclassified Mesorhizobium]|uniref:integrase catalytic domain-containing protein n=1 Tax=unclassified Mesorhizobium TaxID=325217 RepID=UPI001927DF95|nr:MULTISPECIES: DDE-type integrase/transposase/recombinase [unclassified Mesorhizobium]BCG82924.1 transposase [Mesorhizobium sp. 113-3-3]BCG90801.1 transposase [Mesorhizobium sp. 113-3-9]